ncbi:MAG TPA: hypothetical protein VIY08_01960 [Candidatus Nitrosocosmicus sp.]
MVNNKGYIVHKLCHKKRGRRRHGYDVYKRNHPVIPKEIVNIFDLSYLA